MTLVHHAAYAPVALPSCSEHDLDTRDLDMLELDALDLDTLACVLQPMLQTTRRIELATIKAAILLAQQPARRRMQGRQRALV